MATCEYCTLVEKGEKIVEDDKSVVVLSAAPASKGHLLVLPKQHYTILEQVPDFLAGHLFNVANTVSTMLFETLRIHGTNIIIENGTAAGQKIAHMAINIIPRSENDGLGFNWQPRQLSEDAMSSAELQLKDASKNIGAFEAEKKEPVNVDKKEKVIRAPDEAESYLLRQLHRIP